MRIKKMSASTAKTGCDLPVKKQRRDSPVKKPQDVKPVAVNVKKSNIKK